MNKLIFIFTLLFSVAVTGETIKIFDEPNYSYSMINVLPEFEVNRELNRAWVNIVISEGSGDSSYYHDNRVKIEGLSYDPAEKAIVLERNGERIVCGHYYHRRFVIDYGRSLKLTNRCTFEVKQSVDEVDDGFEIKKTKMIRVFFNIN